MPARKEYTPEFKDQAVRFVLEEIEVDESRKHACDRLAPKLSVKAVTLLQLVEAVRAGQDAGVGAAGFGGGTARAGAVAEEGEPGTRPSERDLVGRGGFFRGGARPPKEVAVFVAAHRHHGVVPICRTLQVAPSAVRSAMSRPVCARRATDEAVKPRLLEVFNANYRVYGRRKMKAALRREHGISLGKDRIARLMRELGIRGATRTRGTVTTRSDRSSPRAPDLVNRRFSASRPNQLWVCDFTYVATWSGFAYTAFVTDVYSRRIVEAGNTWSTACDPWAVVVRHGRWYLLCRTHPRDAIRTYRIDRINEIEPLDSTFEPPDHLDPGALLETHLASGWEHPTEIIIDAPLTQVTPWISPVLGTLQPIDPNTTRLTGTTSNPTWYAEQLTHLPAPFRIVADNALHNAATTLAHRLLAATQ